MSFLIRQISARATGGTITRTRRTDQPSLVIGRATDSDIVLEDLAVLLSHARLTQSGSDSIELEALDGAAVSLGGRLVTRERVAPSAAPVIVLGGQRLTLGPGEASGEISVTVERLEEPAPARDERDTFALSNAMPSRRTFAWLLGALVIGLFLLWPIFGMERGGPEASVVASANNVATRTNVGWQPAKSNFHPDETWSSGPLSPPHRFLEGNCSACHTEAFKAVRDENCLACHGGEGATKAGLSALKDHADPTRLLAVHPKVAGFEASVRAKIGPAVHLPDWTCTGCHREHEGAVQTPASTDRFCAGCHAKLKQGLPDTVLLDTPSWAEHPEFRPTITDNSGTTPIARKVSLSAKPSEVSGLKFPHDLHLSTTNGVAQMARSIGVRHGYGEKLLCKDCHASDRSGVGFKPVSMEENCAVCHALEFAIEGGVVRTLRHGHPGAVVAELRDYLTARGPERIAATDRQRVGLAYSERATMRKRETVLTYGASVPALIRAVFEPGGACHDCHEIRPPADPASFRYKVKEVAFTERYLSKGWFSHADHGTKVTPCKTCHAAEASQSARELLLPGVQTCRNCHASEHPSKTKVATGCASCHSYHEAPGTPATLRAAGPDKDSGTTALLDREGSRSSPG